MPQISRFYGIVIGMYFDEHNPPHFHAKYSSNEAVIRIKDFAVTEGYLPPKALGLVIEWAALHQDELLKNWQSARNGKKLLRIEPLE
jgi:hypothetical protein